MSGWNFDTAGLLCAAMGGLAGFGREAAQGEGGVDRRSDVDAALEALRERRALSRRTRYRKSRLDPYRSDLVAWRLAGASIAELAYWLATTKCRKVAATTVSRYLARLPEIRAIDQGGDRDKGEA